VAPPRNEQASRIISQLGSRYMGLSIQSVAEKTGVAESIERELEAAKQTINQAAAEVSRSLSDSVCSHLSSAR
jgi:hypothetical protein